LRERKNKGVREKYIPTNDIQNGTRLIAEIDVADRMITNSVRWRVIGCEDGISINSNGVLNVSPDFEPTRHNARVISNHNGVYDEVGLGFNLEDWLDNFDSDIGEFMNAGAIIGWWGGGPSYAVTKMDGATIRFRAELAYTDLQRYDEVMLLSGGTVDRANQLQECIRFWASSAIWSVWHESLEAPYWCGPTFTYRDSWNGELTKWMGSNIQVYDISPAGYTWERNINRWGTGMHTWEGYQWFPHADDWRVQRAYKPRRIHVVDVTFEVPPASFFANQYMNTPVWPNWTATDRFRERWNAGANMQGGLIPCVEWGITMNITRGYRYEQNILGSNFSWKQRDTACWLYNVESWINGVPSDEYLENRHNGAPYFSWQDGRLSFSKEMSGGTVSDALFPLATDARGMRWINNDFKKEPWARYPSL
jgi:hypothetical protein